MTGPPAAPGHDYPFRRLPVNADEGFPQAFRLDVAGGRYALALSVTVLDDALLTAAEPLDLPTAGAYLVGVLTREAPGRPGVILRRRLVRHHTYLAGDLALVFTEMAVDPRNLNGAGAFGSRVVGGVASRWAS